MLRIYIEDNPEKQRIMEICRKEAVFADREGCHFPEDREGESPDLAIFQMEEEEDLEKILEFRQSFTGTPLLVLVDAGISPEVYIRPDLQVGGVLELPFNEDRYHEKVGEMIRYIVKGRQEGAVPAFFQIQSKGTDDFIPYERISYFESKNKLIMLHFDRGKWSFYDTLKGIAAELPTGFVRCHRSYIVNAGHIRRIDRIKNQIVLEDGDRIPLSARYKKQIYGVLR